MTKTIKLEGEALQVARDINEIVNKTNARMRELQSEADALRDGTHKKIQELLSKAKTILGVDQAEHLHIDADYLEDHGLAFAKTG